MVKRMGLSSSRIIKSSSRTCGEGAQACCFRVSCFLKLIVKEKLSDFQAQKKMQDMTVIIKVKKPQVGGGWGTNIFGGKILFTSSKERKKGGLHI